MKTNDHVAALDGVRGVAILVVLIHNTCFVLRGSSPFPLKLLSAVTATGWTGVQLFFVLSGFLITGILMEARGAPRFFRTFYIRRTLRIFPLYYVFLALTILVLPRLVELSVWSAVASRNQWWFWGYASNWGNPFGHDITGLSHFWSLAVEEQFYLVWPPLVFMLSRRGLIGWCIVVLLATPVVRFLLHEAGLPTLAAYEFTVARWDALAAGAVLAILLTSESGVAWLHRHMRQIGAAALLALALFVLVEHGFHEDDVYVQVVGQTLIAILAAWLVYVAGVAPASATARTLRDVLSSRGLRFLGKYSYAIYVIHYPIHRVASYYLADAVNGADTLGRLPRLVVYVGGVGALSILTALLSWRLLEKPFLELKDRLAPRGPSVAPGSG